MKLDEKKLFVIMANKGMLLKDLCEAAPISRENLWAIRKGKQIPLPATLGRIAKALGVSVADIIEEGDFNNGRD